MTPEGSELLAGLLKQFRSKGVQLVLVGRDIPVVLKHNVVESAHPLLV